jgi:hypothetical protein
MPNAAGQPAAFFVLRAWQHNHHRHAREGGASSTPRPLDSKTEFSGILDHPSVICPG